MSKNYQKAAIRRIFALAVLIAGTCYIAATAWATTCFLPSGNCSTGRVGNEDGGGEEGGDESNPGPGTQEDACKDFTNNTTKSEYDWKNKTSCFVCTTCTSNGNTKYNCEKASGYSWDSSDGGHCCVSGEKWYSKMGMCCSSTSGCTCPTLKKWSNGECVCQYAKTSTGTCCEKGKIADKHLCCNAGEHAENTICCPANKHEQNGSCVCDTNYETDGTGCKPIDKCKGYDLTASQAAQYNNNCYVCSQCGSNTAKYKCEVRTTPLNGYKLDNGTCKKEAKTYTITVDDYGEFNSGTGEYIFQRSVTYDSPDASIDIISGYNCNRSSCSGPSTLGGTFTKSISTRMDTIQSNVGGNGGDYQLNLSFTGCSIKINGTTKSIRSVSPCESTTIQMPNGDKYIVVYSFNGNVSKKSCSDRDLNKESDCRTGEIFISNKTYPIDDFGNKCGTCKYNYIDIYLDKSSPDEIYCYRSANNSTRKYTRVNIYLTDEKGNKAKDIYGNTVAKITSSGARFTKGNYILNLAWEADDYSVIPYIEMMSLMPVSAAATTDKCWGNGQEALDSGCEKPLSVSGNSTAFRSSSYTFEAGDHYRVGYSYSYPKGVTCKKYK